MIQDFIAKLSPKEKKALYIAVIVVTLAFLDRLFLGPTMVKLKSLDEEIGQQENVIKGDLRFLSFKERILKENEAFNSFYSQGTQTEEEIIAVFLKKIEMLASQSSINLARVSPAESKKKKGYIEYYVSLECGGTLTNMTDFLYALETAGDLMRIVKLSVNPKKVGSDEVVAAMSVMKVIIDNTSIKEAEKLKKKPTASMGESPAIPSGPVGNIPSAENSSSVVVTQTLEPNR